MKNNSIRYVGVAVATVACLVVCACGESPESARKSLVESGVIKTEQALTSAEGRGAFARAASQGDAELLRKMIIAGVDVNAPYADGKTALVEAGYKGRVEIVKMLIEAGADVKHVSSNGLNILMHTAFGGDHVEVVRVLLDAGADASWRSRWGSNALGYAKHHHRTQIVKLLEERGIKE